MVRGLSSVNKTQIIVVAYGNAAGHVLSPMIILKGKNLIMYG